MLSTHVGTSYNKWYDTYTLHTSLRGMLGEESAVGNSSEVIFLSEGESLEEDPVDIDFTPPDFFVDTSTQVI